MTSDIRNEYPNVLSEEPVAKYLNENGAARHIPKGIQQVEKTEIWRWCRIGSYLQIAKYCCYLSKTVERRKLHGNISSQMENNNNSDSGTESTLKAADNAYSQSTIQESSQQIVNTDIHQPSTSGNKVTNAFSTPSSTTLQSKKNTNNRLQYAKNSETNSMDDKFLEIGAKLEKWS